MRQTLLAVVVLACPQNLQAQETDAPLAFEAAAVQPATARFDVVSIRPLADPGLFLPIRIAPNGWLQGRTSLRGLIHLSYGAQPYERIVAAKPDESHYLEDWFEVLGRPPEAPLPPSREDSLAMTRHLLADRFGVRMRIDTELVRATVLRVISPGALGPGLRPAPEGCLSPPRGTPFGDARFADAYERSCSLTLFGERFLGTVTLDDFAQLLSFMAQRPIVNRTDLPGLFRIDVTAASASWRPDVTRQSDAPAFVDALRDQMGLSAREERDQPVRRFVVEHVGPLVEN